MSRNFHESSRSKLSFRHTASFEDFTDLLLTSETIHSLHSRNFLAGPVDLDELGSYGLDVRTNVNTVNVETCPHDSLCVKAFYKALDT
eukprot:1361477-Amorphochlora_amoeboformis.AAC.2